MNNYIQIYKNVISDKYCDELITKFESESKLTKRHMNEPYVVYTSQFK